MEKKKKPMSPEAAKILEQYRNAGKPQQAVDENGAPLPDTGGSAAQKQSAPPPVMPRRSGTRGK